MAHLDARRQVGERVLVCDPSIYVTAIAHTRHRFGIFTFYPKNGYPFTHGAAVMRDEDYLNSEQLFALADQRVWAIDSISPNWTVPAPYGYTLASEERFDGFRDTVVVRQYVRDPQAASDFVRSK